MSMNLLLRIQWEKKKKEKKRTVLVRKNNGNDSSTEIGYLQTEIIAFLDFIDPKLLSGTRNGGDETEPNNEKTQQRRKFGHPSYLKIKYGTTERGEIFWS